MKIIGITGGIGSGKTVICRVFKTWGVPVFEADAVAREGYLDPHIRTKVLELLGQDSYQGDLPDFRYISAAVFGNVALLKSVESIIHPWVGNAFKAWLSVQQSPYVIREAAILIESGTYKDCDEVIVVIAPMDLRMKWIKARNGWTEEQITERMLHQMTDFERQKYATRILLNNNNKLLTPELLSWHQEWSV